MQRLQFLPDEIMGWYEEDGVRYAVVGNTVRTVMGTLLLAPTQRNTALILGVLGRAQWLYGVKIFTHVAMGNHLHMTLGVRDPEHHARVKEYINGNIARELGRPEHSDWQGRFWGGRTMSIPVMDLEDQEAQFRYVLSNGTKENLVRHPYHWPGAHCARSLMTGIPDEGIWVDRTKLRRLRQERGPDVPESEATIRYKVTLSRLPCHQHLTEGQFRSMVHRTCKELEQEAEDARRREGKKGVVGAQALREVDPHTKVKIKRRRAPLVHCRDLARRKAYIKSYRVFVELYQAAHRRLCEGLEAFEFPPGGHPPVRREVLTI